MISQMDVALTHKLRGSLVSLAYFLTCCLCVFVQPGTGRRPVDWCRNYMSVLYLAFLRPKTKKSRFQRLVKVRKTLDRCPVGLAETMFKPINLLTVKTNNNVIIRPLGQLGLAKTFCRPINLSTVRTNTKDTIRPLGLVGQAQTYFRPINVLTVRTDANIIIRQLGPLGQIRTFCRTINSFTVKSNIGVINRPLGLVGKTQASCRPINLFTVKTNTIKVII